MDWIGKKNSKEEIPGSKRGMHGYILTYSILIRWNFNFCVGSSPLQDHGKEKQRLVAYDL